MADEKKIDNPFSTTKKPPSEREVTHLHTKADTDSSPKALHHTLGPNQNQASPGNHSHDGGASTKISPLDGINISGSRTSGAAVASIVAALVTLGAIDTTTP